ncbi:unnamed protein product [Paramecium sonneborni]|uniref:RING-type domain-containing protein n=1 Tax=Paramecium sonneborni TaxID=65129 RepID=A0A8S1RCR5_9CILI|nr:unnamed protein product [Paramecium sonneborni]
MIRILIVIIHFQTIITLQLLEIDINQDVTIFNMTQKRLNQTIQLKIIKEEKFRYLLIELFVKLKSKSNSKLVLLQAYGQAPQYDLKAQKKRILCDKYDANGLQLSKKYHYLQLQLDQNSNLESYLTILTNKTLSYKLVFTASNIELCPNNCSNRGQCAQGKCQCEQGFIDEDCSQFAKFFLPQKQFTISISKLQYIYTIFNTTSDYRLRLTFDSKNQAESKINIQMLISQHHNLPCNFNHNYNHTVLDQKMVEIKLLYDNYLQSNVSNKFPQNFLIIKLESQEDINYKIKIDFQTNYFEKKEESVTIIIVVSFISFLIIIIILIFIYCFRRQNNRSQNKYQHKNPQQSDIQRDTECSICQETIQITQESLENCVKTDCEHIFHNECLNQWLNYQQTCPICREILM